jgi:hypothetical protein
MMNSDNRISRSNLKKDQTGNNLALQDSLIADHKMPDKIRCYAGIKIAPALFVL